MRIVYFLILCCLSGLVLAEEQSLQEQGAWEFEADSLRYEKPYDTTIATGNVIVERQVIDGRQKLQADKVIYNGKDNIVTATGNVSILDEYGNYYQSDYLEVMGDLKHAIITNMQVQLKNYGVLKAQSAMREGAVSVFEKPSYSACQFCKDKPDAPLLWELQADKVIHDEEDKILKYYNTKLLFIGVPIFYTPYFYYPDPTVKRKQGFLLPRFGSDRNVGSFLTLPYFVPFGDHADATIAPIFTGEGGQLLSGNFRLRRDNAKLDGTASFTEAIEVQGNNTNPRVTKNSDRWHVDIAGDYHHDEHWRSGFALNRASDKNYFRRYPFWKNSGNFLQSRIYLERFNKRNYFNGAAYSFQDLRLEDAEATPRIYPNIDLYINGVRDTYGGLWDLRGNMRFLDKSNVVEDRRFYGKASYELPYYSDSGYIASASFNLYSKLQSSDFDNPTNAFGSPVSDDDEGEVVPQVGLQWRMPFYRYKGGSKQIIEPIASLYIAPSQRNDRSLNNNDADIFVLDSHNIMRAHRFNGLDRFDAGQRIAYGVRGSHQANTYNLNGFFGQLYEFSEDEVLKEELSIEEGASDFITSLLADTQVHKLGHVYLDNQLAIDSHDGKLNRHFSQIALKHNDWNFHSNYLYTRRTAHEQQQNQISFTGDKKLSKYWRGGLFATIDWSKEIAGNSSSTRAYGTDFTYDDECFNFKISAYRDFTSSPDVQDGYSVVVTFDLKTLAGTSSVGGSNIGKLSGF